MGKLMTRRGYTFFLWWLLPYIFFHLFQRAFKQPEYLKHIGERFGAYPQKADKPIIWLHTVSVGETRAAVNLVKRLQEAYPDHSLLVTFTTPTGRSACKALYGDSVLSAYLPYDYPFAIKRFLKHFRPVLGVLLETEIWFNLIHFCRISEIPLLLLNARLSVKSAARYAAYPGLIDGALKELSHVAAQTEEDARRLAVLGAVNVSVMGNLKFDIEPPLEMLERGRQLREAFGLTRKVFLMASTRAGEEALLLDALTALREPDLLVVIVPRHPQRFDEVAAQIEKRNFRFQRRSSARPVEKETQVVLGDSMGEMFAYYAACDMAFIGGSLLPFGGQNLIEAASCNKPVLIGPHTYNFTEAARLAVDCGAAIRVQNAAELMRAAEDILSHPAKMEEMRRAASLFVSRSSGATERAMQCMARYMSDISSKITRHG
jgi:3-deoxy-D-manno-octulosonic-acid transferase